MNQSDFIHLHVHSQYSLLDGACRIKNLIKKAIEYNMPALAITDHGNLFGAIDFYQTAIAMGVKPIIGCEIYITSGSRFEKTTRQKGTVFHLTLFARDYEGYHNLMKLVSAGYLEGFYYYPRIDKELLLSHSKGLLCASGCLKGELSWYLSEGNYQKAKEAVDTHIQIFGRDNYYLEIMDNALIEQKKVNEGLLKLSKELNVPLVATNDVHYLEQSHAKAQEVLLCVQRQTTLSDPNRMRMTSDQFYFKSPDEIRRQFAFAPEALSNTLEIANKCNLKLDFGKFHLPKFKSPDGLTKEEYLKKLCMEGLVRRYPNAGQMLKDRLEHELNTIDKMGFAGYFLIVWDFINYAKEHGIPVGPGRGSAAGSIVSYLLGITDLDPLKYGLLFERFLNPERAGMPDIDIDFCFERRQEVIDYVNRKYGAQNVAQIITFGTMQARAAIRDVGRVMGVPYADVDKISKLVPAELGITIEEALNKEPQLKALYAENKTAAELIDTAKVLEGLNRHASIHAAGVVISDKPLTDYVPLFKTSDDQITTGFSMDGIAKIGLLKMDFLGLRTLTVISDAVKLINKRHDVGLEINKIPLNDKKTFELLSKANSFGIFQLESSGMRELLKKLKPTVFEDLIAILALYRPGPMGSGMLDDFIKRKRGDVRFNYDHPKLEPVLKATYGIIVYQEQVMQIASVLAGFTMTQADNLRRAMSKKIQSVMDKTRQDFVLGCAKESRINEQLANKLFDLIDYFSGYGFNKSHSAAYALITYQTAFLKANYPVEFMCALLTNEKDNTEKIVEYVREAEAIGIKVSPPQINECVKEFEVKSDKAIMYGLLAVKNVGSIAIDSIVEKRKTGAFTSIFNLCERIDLRVVNKKVLESLIKCGALDCFGAKRSQLMAALQMALDSGSNQQKEKASGQFSFFDMAGVNLGFNKNVENLPDIKEWQKKEILAFEKEILGFYLSGHPLTQYKVEIKEFANTTTKGIQDFIDEQEVRLVGLIRQIKLTNTRKTNERMAIIKIEDLEGEVEAVVFPSVYVNVLKVLNEGEVVFVKGKVNIREDRVSIIVNDITTINQVYSAIKAIKLDLTSVGENELQGLRDKLRSFPGKVPVYLNLNTKTNKGVSILVGEDLFVSPKEELMSEIKELVGQESLSVTF